MSQSNDIPDRSVCKCFEKCKPRSNFYREIIPLLEHQDIGLNDFQRKVVKRSYVNFVSKVDTMAIQARKRADWTWDIIEYGNLLLAFLAVARDLPFVTETPNAFHVVVGVIYFCSLLVNMAVQIIKRKKYVERYVLYNKVATTLKSLGYNFLSATGKYKLFMTRSDAYRSFIHDIQMLRVMLATSENVLFGRDEEVDMKQKDPEAFDIINKMKVQIFDEDKNYNEDKSNKRVMMHMQSSFVEEDAKSEISSNKESNKDRPDSSVKDTKIEMSEIELSPHVVEESVKDTNHAVEESIKETSEIELSLHAIEESKEFPSLEVSSPHT